MVSKKIQAIRKEAGLSQKEFAEKLGISYGALQNYEYGNTSPTFDTLKKISNTFLIPLGFFTDEQPPHKGSLEKGSLEKGSLEKGSLEKGSLEKGSLEFPADLMENKIKEIRTRMGLSQDEFCKKLDIPKTTYLRYESGEREAPAKVVAKIARLGNVSMEYVICEESAPLDGDSAIRNTPADSILINLYEDIYASAGYGTENEDSKPIPIALGRAFLEKVLGIVSFKKLDIIRVVGDSMLPLIRDGEYVIVDRATDTKNGDTVIANIGGELYVKRLHKEPFSEWVRLESENKDYPAIEINTPERLEQFSIIGVVKCKIKLF